MILAGCFFGSFDLVCVCARSFFDYDFWVGKMGCDVVSVAHWILLAGVHVLEQRSRCYPSDWWTRKFGGTDQSVCELRRYSAGCVRILDGEDEHRAMAIIIITWRRWKGIVLGRTETHLAMLSKPKPLNSRNICKWTDLSCLKLPPRRCPRINAVIITCITGCTKCIIYSIIYFQFIY